LPRTLGNLVRRTDDDPVNSKPQPRLANRVRVARAERNLSQTDLARAVGVSRQTISSIETGQYGPSALLALRLADALGSPLDELFWIEGEGR